MDRIIPFIKEFKANIIGITCLANQTNDKRETSIVVKDIEVRDDYVYFIGKDEVISIPIDGAIVDSGIVDIYHENEVTNLITVFNKKYGYIRTKEFSIWEYSDVDYVANKVT